MPQDEIVAELTALLIEDFTRLAGDGYGDSMESEVRPGGTYETVSSKQIDKSDWHSIHRAITRTPDGRLFEWHYELGLTAYQENLGPDEYGDDFLTEVEAHEKVVVVIEYLPKE